MQANEMRLGGRRELVVVYSLGFLFLGFWGCPFFSFSFFWGGKGKGGILLSSSSFNYSNPKLIISSSILFFIQDPLNR